MASRRYDDVVADEASEGVAPEGYPDSFVSEEEEDTVDREESFGG